MSEITVNFAFELGDIVYFRSASHNADQIPKAQIVFERLAQECHGGIQRLYRLNTSPDLIPEIVLSKEVPPYKKRDESFYEELEIIEAARRVGYSFSGNTWKSVFLKNGESQQEDRHE